MTPKETTESESTKPHYENNHSTLHIPSRDEFHRFASNLLSESDFCTDYPSRIQVERTANAISWTYSNKKRRTNRY